MALFCAAYRPTNLFYRIIFSSIYGKNFFYNDKSLNCNVDVLDRFTTQLIEKKQEKWKATKMRKKYNMPSWAPRLYDSDLQIKSSELDIENYNQEEVDDLFNKYLEMNCVDEVAGLVEKCVKYKLCPAFTILQHVFSMSARQGDEKMLLTLKKLAEDTNPEEVKHYGGFLHYFAEALWVNGKIQDALKLFDQVYRENVYLRRNIRLMLKHLTCDITTIRSEAILVLITKFSETLVEDYEDYNLLSHIWQVCFLSDWFADQHRADELLANYRKLLGFVVRKISFVIYKAQCRNDPEILHRLLELLLKHEVHKEYSKVLQALFDLKYAHGDLKSCSEIIQWSINLQIPLLNTQEMKFVDLLLKPQEKIKKSDPPYYQLKF